MDTRGNLYRFTDEELSQMASEQRRRLIPLSERDHAELEPMTKAERKNNMRNKPCLCGSGKKFKKCCWSTFTQST